jgi:hypothetical protein
MPRQEWTRPIHIPFNALISLIARRQRMMHIYPRIVRCASKGGVTTYTLRGTSGRTWDVTVRKGMVYDQANIH